MQRVFVGESGLGPEFSLSYRVHGGEHGCPWLDGWKAPPGSGIALAGYQDWPLRWHRNQQERRSAHTCMQTHNFTFTALTSMWCSSCRRGLKCKGLGKTVELVRLKLYNRVPITVFMIMFLFSKHSVSIWCFIWFYFYMSYYIICNHTASRYKNMLQIFDFFVLFL